MFVFGILMIECIFTALDTDMRQCNNIFHFEYTAKVWVELVYDTNLVRNILGLLPQH